MLESAPSLSVAAQDEGPIRRRFGNVTNIAHQDWNLSITDGPDPIITFKKNNQDISIYSRNKTKIYELNSRNGEKLFDVFIKGNKVGLLVTSRDIQYNDDACVFSPDPFKKVLSDDLPTKIEDVAYSDEFFGGTCSKLSNTAKDTLRGTISAELNPSTSYMMKCLTSESTKKDAAKDKDLAVTANKLITRYVDELTKIQSGKSDFKIECGEGDKAKYDPKRTAMILPIKGAELQADLCKSNKEVFSHEFLHHAGLSQPEASALDNRCLAANNSPKKDKTCKEVASTTQAPGGGPVAHAAKTQAAKENKALREEMAPVIAADFKTTAFIPVQDDDIKEIANPSSPATYEASVERVHKAMSTNMEKIAAPLNRAIATTISPARADSTVSSRESISKKTIAKSRLPASAKADDNKEYIVEEYELPDILADKYNVPVESVRAAIAAPNPINPTTKSSSTAAVSKRGAGNVAAPTAAPGGEIASGNSGSGGSSLSPGGGVAGRSVSSGTTGAKSSNSRLPASSGTTVGSDPLVQQLGQFNEVRGRRYREIQDRYDDPTFEPELRAKNIAIRYLRNNKTTTIGDTTDKRTLFLDDGTVLKKVTGAK
jgi:hypothetical protein